MSTTVGAPNILVPFVDEKRCLTPYAYAILAGLRTRSGGTDGIDITELQNQIEGEFQDIREAPVIASVGPFIFSAPDDESMPITFVGDEPDEPSTGQLVAMVYQLKARIEELEEAPQWHLNPSL